MWCFSWGQVAQVCQGANAGFDVPVNMSDWPALPENELAALDDAVFRDVCALDHI